MRILYVIPFYKPAYAFGGPVRSVSTMCEGLARQGVDVTVFTTTAGWAAPEGFEAHYLQGEAHPAVQNQSKKPAMVAGVEVYYFPLGFPSANYYSPALVAALRERVREFDLVIGETLWELMILPLQRACAAARKPYLVKVSGQLYPWALRRGLIKKSIYLRLFGRGYLNRAGALLSTCAEEASALASLNLASPIWIIPNGIDSAIYHDLPARGMWREKWNIPAQARVLLFSGRLTRIKRPDIAIQACAELRERWKIPAYLIVAGPDEDGMIGDLQRLARQDRIEQTVFFTGLLDESDLLQALADADLLLMPTEVQENFGLAALEALAAGLPVLTSPGIPMGLAAQQAGAGRVVECTPQAFAQAAGEMLSNPDELAEMGGRARSLAWGEFDIETIARDLLLKINAGFDFSRQPSGQAVGD